MSDEIVDTPISHQPAQRFCYAGHTLVAEVLGLFPETPYQVSGRDGRGVALAVQFDLSALEKDRADQLAALLFLAVDDHRIEEVLYEDALLLTAFKSNARTQDDRSPFGLNGALAILDEPFQQTEDEVL